MKTLGYAFADLSYLEAALTHRSYAHEHGIQGFLANERLEFLGDALLNYISGAFLYTKYPERGEGDLTMLRSSLVQTRMLATFAREFRLDRFVRISKGEEHAGGRRRDNLLADTFEAILAAIALDGGVPAAQTFIHPLLDDELARIESGESIAIDYKTMLQQRIQGEISITPSYRKTGSSGPDHSRQWTIEVWAAALKLGTGTGSSKQAASQIAARRALEWLDGSNPPTLPSAEKP